MQNILPKRVSTATFLVFFGLLICALPVLAQDDAGLSEEKAAQYQIYIDNGGKYLDQGRFREAITEFNRALLIDPLSGEAKRGIIKANQEIAARSAVPDIESIEQDRLDFHLTKGTEYYDAEKYDEAIVEWNEALRIAPDNKLAHSLIEAAKSAKVDVLVERGHDEFFVGNLDKAIEIWEEAQTIVPNSIVLADLLAEANEARYTLRMEQIETDLDEQMYDMRQYLRKQGLLPEGASPDGLKYEDVSLRPTAAGPKEFGAREEILKELSQPVAFEFECEPLRDVLRFLTTITGINILVDEDIFDQFGKDEDCYGNEVDRQEIFVTIHVSELPLESALNGMLRQHGLGFSIERDFIYVSTPDILRGSSFEQLETRFYHLKDTSRISLPKLDTTGSAGAVGLGGTRLDTTSGQSLVSRVKEIKGKDLMEIDPQYQSMSIPKLVNILRTFVPHVLDPSKTTSAKTTRAGEDKVYGGLSKSDDPFKLFEESRVIWADTSGREILSLIEFDAHTNTLIVRNTPTNLDMVEVFLDHLDHEPRQIAVEAKFINYSILEAKKVGVDFAMGDDGNEDKPVEFGTDTLSTNSILEFLLGATVTDTITPADLAGRGGEMLLRFTKDDGEFLQATFNLLDELQNTQTISAPKLVTMHNKPAVIQDVVTRPFRTNVEIETDTTVTDGIAVTNISFSQEYTDVTEGVSLSITPQIQPDNTIRLFLLPDISAITEINTFETVTGGVGGEFDNSISITNTRPTVSRQSIFTNVVVNDGDTIVVGGLIRDQETYQDSGVPFFRDIPLVGRLFENETKLSDKTNLLVFITVNIMDARGVSYTRLK